MKRLNWSISKTILSNFNPTLVEELVLFSPQNGLVSLKIFLNFNNQILPN